MDHKIISTPRAKPGRPPKHAWIRAISTRTHASVIAQIAGGKDVINMLAAHHEENRSIRQLAADFRLSRSAVHRKLQRAKRNLRKYKLLPSSWETHLNCPASAGHTCRR